jgi:hypothetical protein
MFSRSAGYAVEARRTLVDSPPAKLTGDTRDRQCHWYTHGISVEESEGHPGQEKLVRYFKGVRRRL